MKHLVSIFAFIMCMLCTSCIVDDYPVVTVDYGIAYYHTYPYYVRHYRPLPPPPPRRSYVPRHPDRMSPRVPQHPRVMSPGRAPRVYGRR